MLDKNVRRIIAALQGIIGIEWLISGINKVANGAFPQGLGGALSNGLSDNPNAWYVSFLQALIIPNGVFWGYMIEWTEVLIGLALVGGALLLLERPRRRGEAQFHAGVAFAGAAAVAGFACAVLCLNFHWWMGGSLFLTTLDPSHPYNEGVDLDAMMPLFALLVIVANVKLVAALREQPVMPRLSAFIQQKLLRRAIASHPYATPE
jgi:hypothetical protein